MLYGGGTGCGSTALSFVLPVPPAGIQGTPFPQISGSAACSTTSTFDYSVLDFNGDGREDLLVTQTCEDPNIGIGALLVYTNTGSAFAPAIQYALPALPTTPDCVQSALIDVDGDAQLDFVVTSLCTDTTVGTTRWLVYPNTGSAFDLSGQSYALPTNAALHAFPSVEVDVANCSLTQPAFAFYDITGDAIPDIVVTTACDDATIGITHWRVYPGTATGVTAPATFTLPGNSVFATPLSGVIACAQNAVSTPSYSVVDFNGDSKPDLVVTQSCTDTNAGLAHWSVFTNDGTAFTEQPTFVPLPVLAQQPSGAFDALTASVPCSASASLTFNHTFVDFDGDLKPDIVATETCGDPLVGASYWLFMRNNGTSFDAPEVFELPAALDATKSNLANNLTGALACSGSSSTLQFGSTSLLGLPLDVVITASCSDPSVGVSRWLAFVPSCP